MSTQKKISALRLHFARLSLDNDAYHRLDEYWKKAADFIQPRLAAGDRLIAPAELANCFSGDQCERQTYAEELSGKYQWIVLHKGMLPEAHQRGLMGVCLAMEPVFANEVFVIFAERGRSDALPADDGHYRSFLEQLDDVVMPGRAAAASS